MTLLLEKTAQRYARNLSAIGILPAVDHMRVLRLSVQVAKSR